MPEVKYIFTAQDKTKATVNAIRRNVTALGRAATTARINVRASGLAGVRNGLRDMAKTYTATIDARLGDESGLTALRDIAENRSVNVNYILGEESGVIAARDLPESRSVRVDYVLGEEAGLTAARDLPESRDVRVDYTLGAETGLTASRDIPATRSVAIDYTLGGTAGIAPLRDIPEARTVSIDYEVGGTSGAQQMRDLPERRTVSIDYTLGSSAGILPLRDMPASRDVIIDYTLGGTAGILPLRDMPANRGVIIDYTLGATGGILPLRDMPTSRSVIIDYQLGAEAGLTPGRDLQTQRAVIIDYQLGSTSGILPLRDMPESRSVRIDYTLGESSGTLPLRDLPDSHGILVDYSLGDESGLTAGRDAITALEVSVDFLLGNEAALNTINDLAENHSVAISYTLGSQEGLAPLNSLAESYSVRIDYNLGSDFGFLPLQQLPENRDVRIDYTLGEEAGIAANRELPESRTVTVDYPLGDESGITAIRDLPSSHTVTVDSVAGSTADISVSGGGAGGGGESPLLPAIGGLHTAIAALTSFLITSQLAKTFSNMVQSWKDIDAALGAVAGLASNIGQPLTDAQLTEARRKAEEISTAYDVSTNEALGVMYMGLQQGRSFEEMTEGGIAERMVKISLATKGFGQTTMEALPSVVSAITDILDRNPDMTIDDALAHAEKLAITYVGSGKGDITNFARAMGLISGQAGMQQWSQNEALAFLSAGLGGFARPSEAATGQRNLMRDLSVSSGKKEAYGAYRELGLVREGSEVYDDKGNVVEFATTLFDEASGMLLTPERLIPMLKEAFGSVEAHRVPRLLRDIVPTQEAQQFFDFLIKSASEEKYARTLEQYETADAERAAAIRMDTATGRDEILAGRRQDSQAMIAEMMGAPGMVSLAQGVEGSAHDAIKAVYDKWLENQGNVAGDLLETQLQAIRVTAPHLEERDVQLAAALEQEGAGREALATLYDPEQYAAFVQQRAEQERIAAREQRRVELEERAAQLKEERRLAQGEEPPGPGGPDSLGSTPVGSRIDALNLEGRDRVIGTRTAPISTRISALNLDAGLSGAPPVPMLPEEQQAMQTIAPPEGVADVTARVTELDTSAVEGQLIKIAADVVLNAVTSPDGTRITQDTTTGRNEIYNSRTLAGRRQAATLEDAR